MRGAPNCSGVSTPISRIIPADAGSTKAGFGQSALERDHPRGCGEHGPLWRNAMTLCGSSPRMRGAHSRIRGTRIIKRIIPADAGSTCCKESWPWPAPDHPRGCGEHQLNHKIVAHYAGSSPRMRGALEFYPVQERSLRIIPADAGSTAPMAFEYSASRDHPRGCGEHQRTDNSTGAAPGSSPRMRGALEFIECELGERGIIPADAGSTCPPDVAGCERRDHPRGCGEHPVADGAVRSHGGSSPRMRGAPIGREYLIIVAEDHPRGCGEHEHCFDEYPIG